MARKIKYVEPTDYLPKAAREKVFGKSKKTTKSTNKTSKKK